MGLDSGLEAAWCICALERSVRLGGSTAGWSGPEPSPFPEGGHVPCVGLLPPPQIHHERLVGPGKDVEGYVLFK